MPGRISVRPSSARITVPGQDIRARRTDRACKAITAARVPVFMVGPSISVRPWDLMPEPIAKARRKVFIEDHADRDSKARRPARPNVDHVHRKASIRDHVDRVKVRRKVFNEDPADRDSRVHKLDRPNVDHVKVRRKVSNEGHANRDSKAHKLARPKVSNVDRVHRKASIRDRAAHVKVRHKVSNVDRVDREEACPREVPHQFPPQHGPIPGRSRRPAQVGPGRAATGRSRFRPPPADRPERYAQRPPQEPPRRDLRPQPRRPRSRLDRVHPESLLTSVYRPCATP